MLREHLVLHPREARVSTGHAANRLEERSHRDHLAGPRRGLEASENAARFDIPERCPLAVQVTVQAARFSFPDSSQSGEVQMSLAWAETEYPTPMIRAA